jgi:biopolymer transport protein ExbB
MRRTSTESRSFLPRLAVASVLTVAVIALAGGADSDDGSSPNLDAALRKAEVFARWGEAWYRRTPPSERVTWGGLAASVMLGLGVVLERWARLRGGRVVPAEFRSKFLERLTEGKLDRGKGLDYCELNPSPAARVALAAVRRWGRPTVDLERAIAMARQLEVDRLRRNVGTLRRIAALAPLVGLLGSLMAVGRILAGLGAAATPTVWAPALAGSLAPLTAGVALAILALVAYDGFTGRVESLAGSLDRIGAETVDAIAMAPPEPHRASIPVPHLGRRAEIHEASQE